jgi:hypothetical protein
VEHKMLLDRVKYKHILSVTRSSHTVVYVLVGVVCEGEVVACKTGVGRLEMRGSGRGIRREIRLVIV